jgi:hypothetical protein
MRIPLVLLALAPSLLGWGNEGHSLIARIAGEQLTPAARARVLALLGPDKPLASIASWADEVRRSRAESGPWHFIDIQIADRHLDMARDCPKNDCVIAKIAAFQSVLRDPAATPLQQREALMFIVHFVGDMHQPLHCSDNHDRGGNGQRVHFNGRDTNLHSVWDSGLLGRMPAEDQLFAIYSPESKRRARKWDKGTPADWADEIHRKSVKITYGKLPKAAPGAILPLGGKYEKAAGSLLREQIEKAGARLAFVLNSTLL